MITFTAVLEGVYKWSNKTWVADVEMNSPYNVTFCTNLSLYLVELKKY